MTAFMTTADTADTLGGRIASARAAAGLDVRQLARHMAVKQSTIDNWESDRSAPRANKLLMLSGVLGVAPTWLLNGGGESPTSVDPSTDIAALRSELLDMRARAQRLLDQIDRVVGSLE
jgi:transcriptional regulator with XRE-family HTH domain